MFVRSTLLACAAAAIVSTAAFAQTSAAPARCEETSFRIYFAPASSALDANADRMLAVAERSVAGCAYSELHVSVGGANAAERGEAVRAALDDRAWNVVRIEPRSLRRVSHGAPEYAEVLMTPRVVPAAPAEAEREAGV